MIQYILITQILIIANALIIFFMGLFFAKQEKFYKHKLISTFTTSTQIELYNQHVDSNKQSVQIPLA